MTDKFEIKGEWFLPANKGQKVHGRLTFDPLEKTELELYGSLSDSDDFSPEFINQEIILGLTSNSKQVTLSGCYMTKSSGATLVQDEESGKPTITYSIRFLLVGLHADAVDNLKFNQISAEIFNLGEWVGISGFKRQDIDLEKIKNREVTVEYKLPESIHFEIDSNTKGGFNFVANNPGLSRYQKSVAISQKVEFQAISVTEKSITELLEYIITFQNFLTLALYKSTYPVSISLKGERHKKDHGDGQLRNKIIKLFFSSRNFRGNEKPKFDIEMIFDYRRLGNDFPMIIRNWYSKYKLLEPAFDLVFE